MLAVEVSYFACNHCACAERIAHACTSCSAYMYMYRYKYVYVCA